MKKEVIFETASNEKIAADVYDLRLKGDCRAGIRAGQFVEVALTAFFCVVPYPCATFTATVYALSTR